MRKKIQSNRQIYGLFILIIAQVFCAIFFLGDVIDDTEDIGGLLHLDMHLGVELVSAVAMLLAIAVEIKTMMAMYAKQKQSDKSMAVARGALHDVVEAYFDDWALTPAERDVAGFLIKGSSITEIANMRDSAEGTIKTQLNAVYRKAGVSGRSQLVSLLIEDLMDQPLLGANTGG